MNMGFGLYQEQSLKLVMTPELRQAITILQYSSTDLITYLHEQANENPVIELQEISATIDMKQAGPDRPMPEPDWKELISNRATGEYPSINRERMVDPLDFASNHEVTLFEHLEAQLGLMKGLTDIQRKVALYLIGNLDEKGYLELETSMAAEQLGVSAAEVEDILRIVQHLDPVGVAARSLEECILLQLEHAGLDDEHIVKVVREHLMDLAGNRLQKIADSLKISILEVQQIADRMRKLNPRPGTAFAQSDTRYITADVTVEKVGDEYVVMVNDTSAPRVTINRFYEKMLQQQSNQDAAKQFIHEKINAALWLAKSLEQRRLTIMRVTQAIVERQRDFFEHGIHFLKPMTQKEIAEQVDLHESTISRATSNKYVQTPRGLFELKYFFTSALTTANGDAASSESVKKRIKQIIDGEDKRKPLSDQAITELLVKEGLEISRRTVAKYREELLIASSAKRKRF